MVSIVLSYCNNDLQFLSENLRECRKFSDNIIVPYYDYSLDGIKEDDYDIQVMQRLCKLNGAEYLPLTYNPSNSAVLHHNKMRWEGMKKTKYDYVLFLDADEIMDGELMGKWLRTNEHAKYDVVSFECYWYFRERKYRATTTEQAGVLCHKRLCDIEYIFSPAERWEFFNRLNYITALQHKTIDNKIVCHHYSWVRTKEQMLQKVKSWGHKNDKDWVSLVEEEFTHEFQMKDFVHNYNYEIV